MMRDFILFFFETIPTLITSGPLFPQIQIRHRLS